MVLQVAEQFYREGSARHGVGGYATVLNFNEYREIANEVDLRPETDTDWRLIYKLTGQKLFYYAPALWRLGYTNHWDYDENSRELAPYVSQDKLVSALGECRQISLDPGFILYRARVFGLRDFLLKDSDFDTPPRKLIGDGGRFDLKDHPVLYCGEGIEVCIHESRATMIDEINIAYLEPTRRIRILDLSENFLENHQGEFESAQNFFNGLSFSREQERIDVCRRASMAIKTLGYDGFRYPSFYSFVQKIPHRNIAIFGYPIADGMLSVRSINNVYLTQIDYQYRLGPALDQTPIEIGGAI